ncbi:hypothetical protein ACIQ7N_22830, partial [Lysinibacillus sp. NPDC095746]|uniref:hypothetical protein n=1 Tax=Lysinibacillus sp. NPDC095746 TaxID=3364134 RepID=UPI00382DBA4C
MKAKRQQHVFCLCESEAAATKQHDGRHNIKYKEVIINVNTYMYIFARLRMYKITRFPRLNDALIGM